MSTSFATAMSFLDTPAKLQESIMDKLQIPSFFFYKMYRESNGFFGCNAQLNRDEESYDKMSRL